eukprot:3233025-Alexandrium_andersonii.AAC.1
MRAPAFFGIGGIARGACESLCAVPQSTADGLRPTADGPRRTAYGDGDAVFWMHLLGRSGGPPR